MQSRALTTAGDETVIGEVVEAATTYFVAQCIDCERSKEMQLFEPPEFGSLIKVMPLNAGESESRIASVPDDAEPDEEEDPFAIPVSTQRVGDAPRGHSAPPGTIYAAVSHASMTTLDAGRRPTALGYADENELRLHQPQIFELITTEFAGALLAYSQEEGRLRRSLPPRPPRLHSRVYPCTIQETLALTEDLQFLQRVLKGTPKLEASPHDLCAAIVRHGWASRGYQDAYLQQAGQQLAAILGSDYDSLQTILRSVIA